MNADFVTSQHLQRHVALPFSNLEERLNLIYLALTTLVFICKLGTNHIQLLPQVGYLWSAVCIFHLSAR